MQADDGTDTVSIDGLQRYVAPRFAQNDSEIAVTARARPC